MILVDFRGFDTFGEIIVLGIAAVAIFALLDTALRGAAARRLAAMRHPEQARDAHPLLPVVATRVLLPIAITVAIYIFLRGHNAPGGGFIAGLVVAIALIMQYIASGYAWAATRARVDAQAMIGGGVALAGLTGIAAWYFERPFLTSAHGHFHIPLIGDIELASATAFDLGVMLTVVGAVLLSLRQISRVEQRAEHEPVPEGPMDIQLPAAPEAAYRTAAARSGRLRSSSRSTGAIADMEALVASAIGLMTAVGVYLVLRRTTFPVVIGLGFLSYATNLYLLTMGRLVIDRPPIISAGAASYTDPLPQALVLTAIVISFGMTALIVVIALRSFLETGSDRADLGPGAAQERRSAPRARAAGRACPMTDLIVLPTVLPALTAAFLLLAVRYDLKRQRVISVAATAGLLALAIVLYGLAERRRAASLSSRRLAGAVRHRARARPPVGDNARARRRCSRCASSSTPSTAGTRAGGTSTRCSSSSCSASTAPF